MYMWNMSQIFSPQFIIYLSVCLFLFYLQPSYCLIYKYLFLMLLDFDIQLESICLHSRIIQILLEGIIGGNFLKCFY